MKLSHFYAEVMRGHVDKFPPTIFAILAKEDRIIFFTSFQYKKLEEQVIELIDTEEFADEQFKAEPCNLETVVNLSDLLGQENSSFNYLLTESSEGSYRSALIFYKGERKSYEGAPAYSGCYSLSSSDLISAVTLLNKKNMIPKALLSHTIKSMNEYEKEHLIENLISELQKINKEYYEAIRLHVRKTVRDLVSQYHINTLQALQNNCTAIVIEKLISEYEKYSLGNSDEAIKFSKILRVLLSLQLDVVRKDISRKLCEMSDALSNSIAVQSVEIMDSKVDQFKKFISDKKIVNAFKQQDFLLGLFRNDVHKSYLDSCKYIVNHIEREINVLKEHKLREGRENK